jgi:hypothetical protein
MRSARRLGLNRALQFKEREHTQLGEHSFESMVADVARLETALGIADLARFTAP